jgi:UDP-2,3-diacylglucosamine pyrophosphatase LpxH
MPSPFQAPELVIVASDIEIGPGGPNDDFVGSAWFAEWLHARPTAERVDLVLAGDTFDFLKCPVDGAWPRHIDARVAMEKWRAISSAHVEMLDGIRDWLAGGDRHVWFILGNHDLELNFTELRLALRQRLGSIDRVHFPGNTWRRGGLEIQHGHMHDTMFKVDGPAFLDFEGRRLLNLPWGAVAMLDVAMPYVPHLGPLDRLKPRERVFELLPEARRLAADAFWRYWTRDWWRDLIEGDPVKHVTTTMLREVLYRMGTSDPDLVADPVILKRLDEPDAPDVLVLGHYHRAGWQTQGNRKLLMLGAFRNEFPLASDGTIGPVLNKTHAEIWMDGDRVVSSALVENPPPALPSNYMPNSLEALRPVLDALVHRRRQADRDEGLDEPPEAAVHG